MPSAEHSAIDRLLSDIRRRAAHWARPIVVAIDGRSGAGKSTLAAGLAEKLDALVVSGDDFFAGGMAVRADPPSVLAEDCIDWRRLKGVLAELLASGEARFRPFDWTAFDGGLRRAHTVLRARPVIIVEGVYSARPELRDVVDLCVFVDVPHAVRMRRLAAREGGIGAWERQWLGAEDWYFSHVLTPDHVDFVVTPERPAG